jgi:hypothetical protein
MLHWQALTTYCKETSNVIGNPSADRFGFNAYRCSSKLAAQPYMGIWSKRWPWTRRRYPGCPFVDGQDINAYPDHLFNGVIGKACSIQRTSKAIVIQAQDCFYLLAYRAVFRTRRCLKASIFPLRIIPRFFQESFS